MTFKIRTIIQIVAIFSISLLVSIATIVRQHATVTNYGQAQQSRTSSRRGRLPPPPSDHVKNEIKSLEQELERLQNKMRQIQHEMITLIKPAEKRASNGVRESKQWWQRVEVFTSFAPAAKPAASNDGSIIPIDLSVNHLQHIMRAPGSQRADSLVKTNTSPEDFLPIVETSDIEFRWRSRARPGSSPANAARTTAYRIIARRAHSSSSASELDDSGVRLWDSGKVTVDDGLPDVVRCGGSKLIGIGSIVEWRVTVWDSSKPEGRPATSEWTKFAVGPSQNDWQGRWISHPSDVETFENADSGAFWRKGEEDQFKACHNWKKRSQLPIFRVQVPPLDIFDNDRVATALLVVSGLGSFRASFDGEPLSSSGPLDPPLTDFAQRVSYRGFDVTPFVANAQSESVNGPHVIGISMGSGWWDHRPIHGSFIRLFLFPRGAITCVAQLHVTYKSGRTKIFLPTGHDVSGWQVAKGYIRESSLFTGEYIDLRALTALKGWDTSKHLELASQNDGNNRSWVTPIVYRSDTSLDDWRKILHLRSGASADGTRKGLAFPQHKMAPIGRLIPHEAPPVLPMERISPDEVHDLGEGRWLYDFGKAFSGMIRFEDGLPDPIIPPDGKYPRGHSVKTLDAEDKFITVLYGETLEISTGDINLVVVAGMGLHDGGPRHKSGKIGQAEAKGGPCYPKDHDAGSLLQRDVYILPPESANEQISAKGSFSDARQSHFTTHSFRFAEICCTAKPPQNLYGLSYRTAFSAWGNFSSSNIRINGGYELVKNALNSNMLGVQSDCAHREKIQYGGDIIAGSPSAMHFYDLSAFYRKAIFDWRDQQWDNGAYAGTSYWLALNDYAGIGEGAGETVWAAAAPVMTVRHMQHYGDLKLVNESFPHHMEWLNFLIEKFDAGLKKKGYHEELVGYVKEGSGLGDWLSMRGRDTWLMHQAFYMAAARSIAYLAQKLGTKKQELQLALELSASLKDRISRLYLLNGKDLFTPPEEKGGQLSPGPEMSLFARIVPGQKRCTIMKNYFKRQGHTWPGSEENAFLRFISNETKYAMVKSGELTKRGDLWSMGWSQWNGFNEGIFAVRYALKSLSENGFHNVALNKANGFGVGTFDYMLSHNATTLWESWWRSEDLYSRNHPMLGASAEWMVSAVAGVSLQPTTTGGKEVLFWPRFPNSASTINYAGATQGTRRGDFSIAWKFLDLPRDSSLYDSAAVKIAIRVYVPPDGTAMLRVPEYSNGEGLVSSIKYAVLLPDIETAKMASWDDCHEKRKAKMGYGSNWEYLIKEKNWIIKEHKKAIGTPCSSFLFHPLLDNIAWSQPETLTGSISNGIEVPLRPGLYDLVVDKWQLKPEVAGSNGRIGSIPEYYKSDDLSYPYCDDPETFDWDLNDATHMI